MTAETLNRLLLIRREGKIYIDHTTGQWISEMCDTGLIKVVDNDGPVQCLVAKLNDLGDAVVDGCLEVSQMIIDRCENGRAENQE